MSALATTTNRYEVRVFDANTGVTLQSFELEADDFPSAMEAAHPEIEAVALDCFAKGGQPEVELVQAS